MSERERDVLVVFPTRYCNIECDHCIVDSGPRQRGRIDQAAANAAIDGAAEAGAEAVVFSGGESLVYESELLALCERAHQRGLTTRVFSNGFWASTPARARATLERLARGHVDELVLSIDRYHLDWVPASRVQHVLEAVAHADVLPFIYYQIVISSPAIACVDDNHGWPPAVLDVLEDYGLPVERCVSIDEVDARCRSHPQGHTRALDSLTREHLVIQWLPAYSGGRTRRRLPTLGVRRPLAEAPGHGCAAVGRQITITPEGGVFPCCSTWTNLGARALGRLADAGDASEFARVIATIRAHPLVAAIHHHGPGRMLELLSSEGHAVRGQYADICDMCEDLLTRFELPELERAATELDGRMLLAWLTSPSPDPRQP